jgi:pyridoxal phosphate enzyme (YggS family)
MQVGGLVLDGKCKQFRDIHKQNCMTSPDISPVSAAQGPSAPTNGAVSGLIERHAAVMARIAAAARETGRDPAAIQLLAVSKTFDARAVLELASHGQRAFGESYLQEAIPKIEACRLAWATRLGSVHNDPLHWHFIGPVQSNKTRLIAQTFDWVHSVDRDRIAMRLSEQRPDALGELQVCVQVDVSGEETKSGCDPQEAVALGQLITRLPRLRLRGVMAIPAPSDDRAHQRAQFSKVRSVFEAMLSAGLDVDTLSIGMSGDLEAAVAEGATIVRVGSALFGSRG